MYHQIKFYSAISLICLSSSLMAAVPIDLQNVSAQGLQALTADQTTFKTTQTSVDFNQTQHKRFQQYYQGSRVWGAEGIVHSSKTGVTMNGMVYQNLTADLQQTPQSALEKSQMEKAVHEAQRLSNVNPNETAAERVVYIDSQNKAHWAYLIQFSLSAHHVVYSKPAYLLDADSMAVYDKWNAVAQETQAPGGGYGGNKKVGKQIYDGLGQDLPQLTILRDSEKQTCYLQNAGIVVKDMRLDEAVVQFPCAQVSKEHNNVYWDGNFDAKNGAFSPSNDAFEAGSVIKNMYQTWYGIPVLTEKGKPMVLNMVVHENMENAYWNGKEMVFGDGGSMFYPLVSIGIGAHEISHGFTEQHSNLVYSHQSGGLNESFSDMASVAAEYFSSGKSVWHIGEEVMKTDEALRYMDDPTKDCQSGDTKGLECSIDNVKDYSNDDDVHFSSGVFNKLFYLLSTTKGWTVKKAFDVMVQANMHYWTYKSDFESAACGVKSAANDFGYDVAAVIQSAAAVGIKMSKC